jgi:hypothetical protein
MAESTTLTAPIPSYLSRAQGGKGLEQAQMFMIPPMVKVVQKQADDKLLERFQPGDVILTPANELIFKRDGETFFTPLLFKPTYMTWNPIELKGAEPAVTDYSDDPTGPLAMKARDPKLRQEKIVLQSGKETYKRHVEHLNFLVYLEDERVNQLPAMISFFRAQWMDGSKFLSQLTMRCTEVPIYATRWRLTVVPKSNNQGSWYALHVSSPADSPWVPEERFSLMEELHEKLKKTQIKTDDAMTTAYSDSEESSEATVGEDANVPF